MAQGEGGKNADNQPQTQKPDGFSVYGGDVIHRPSFVNKNGCPKG